MPLKSDTRRAAPDGIPPLGNDACLGARKDLFAGLPCSRSRDSCRPVATLMRRLVLRIDALFLTVAGVFGLVSDLQSYASASGPFGQTFYQSPTVIGVVEAHGLAVLTAGTLWFLATHHIGCFGHWVAVIAHAVMGGSNIVWFEVFRRVRSVSAPGCALRRSTCRP